MYCNNINEAIISNFWISYEKPFPPLSTLCLVIRVISFNNYHQKLWIMSRLSMGRLGSGICILDKPNRTTSKAKPNWTNFVWLGCPRFLTFSSHANWIQSPQKKKKSIEVHQLAIKETRGYSSYSLSLISIYPLNPKLKTKSNNPIKPNKEMICFSSSPLIFLICY